MILQMTFLASGSISLCCLAFPFLRVQLGFDPPEERLAGAGKESEAESESS